jgi:predicted unusual protein kinase regulating ubiquinone biosynthesis (AarF/ABC1/UbiB family)
MYTHVQHVLHTHAHTHTQHTMLVDTKRLLHAHVAHHTLRLHDHPLVQPSATVIQGSWSRKKRRAVAAAICKRTKNRDGASAPATPPERKPHIPSSLVRYGSMMRTVCGIMVRVLRRESPSQIATWLSGMLPELGPTYVKIAQFVSSRPDVFGADVVSSFRTLQDNVPKMQASVVKEILSLHPELQQVIAHVEEEPIASASIAQVHVAHLHNGNHVILKIKRPGLKDMIAKDLGIMLAFIRLMGAMGLPEAAYAKRMVDDFMAMMMTETDFGKEVKNHIDFCRMYARRSDVIVPRVFADLSTPDIIVMEYVPSVRVMDYAGDRSALAYRLMAMYLGQVLYDGHIIHGDPQPGNLGVTTDDKIVLYDFGNAIRIDDGYRTRLKVAMFYLVTNESREALKVLQALGVKVLDEMLAIRYVDMYAQYVRTIDYSIFDIGERAMPFVLTDDIMRICKVFGTLEGVCKHLDEAFDYASVAPLIWDAFLLDPSFIIAKGAMDIEAMIGEPST